MRLNKNICNALLLAMASSTLLNGCVFFIDRGKAGSDAMNQRGVAYTTRLFRENNLRANKSFDLEIREENKDKDISYYLQSYKSVDVQFESKTNVLGGQPIIIIPSDKYINLRFNLELSYNGKYDGRIYHVRIPNETGVFPQDKIKIYHNGKSHPLK